MTTFDRESSSLSTSRSKRALSWLITMVAINSCVLAGLIIFWTTANFALLIVAAVAAISFSIATRLNDHGA